MKLYLRAVIKYKWVLVSMRCLLKNFTLGKNCRNLAALVARSCSGLTLILTKPPPGTFTPRCPSGLRISR
jgi:hypothetical protein